MNWGVFAKWLLTITAQIPSVVIGVETMIQGAKQGATKKDLALASLGLSSAVAQNLAPEHQGAIQVATQYASQTIDNTVNMLNAIKHPAFVGTATAPASAVPTASATAPAATATVTVAEPSPAVRQTAQEAQAAAAAASQQ